MKVSACGSSLIVAKPMAARIAKAMQTVPAIDAALSEHEDAHDEECHGEHEEQSGNVLGIAQTERRGEAEEHAAAEHPRGSPVAEDVRRQADEPLSACLTLAVDARRDDRQEGATEPGEGAADGHALVAHSGDVDTEARCGIRRLTRAAQPETEPRAPQDPCRQRHEQRG